MVFGAWVPGKSKTVTIAFIFARFRPPPCSVIFFAENLPMECLTTYNASRIFRTISIVPECHQTTHLGFCGALNEWLRNDRKSCSYSRSKLWKSLIYHSMSPRGIIRHSVHAWRPGTSKIVTYNLHFWQFYGSSGPYQFFCQKPSYVLWQDL